MLARFHLLPVGFILPLSFFVRPPITDVFPQISHFIFKSFNLLYFLLVSFLINIEKDNIIHIEGSFVFCPQVLPF